MSQLSDEYRAQATKARVIAGSIGRSDMREIALEIARGWERLAELAEANSELVRPAKEPRT